MSPFSQSLRLCPGKVAKTSGDAHMLLAPFSLTDMSTRRTVNRDIDSRRVPPWLLLWAVGGPISVVLFPVLRGGMTSGMSLPFWLAAAPLINILWLTRRRWMGRLLSSLVRSPAPHPLRKRRGR
jgi:hypothetical protein